MNQSLKATNTQRVVEPAGRSVVSIGVDLVETARILHVVNRFGGRFLEKVFTVAEREYCYSRPRPVEHLAARFAAKEAVLKALGTGWARGMGFVEVEVVRPPSGRAEILLHGTAKIVAEEQGIGELLASLSHTRDYAVAHVGTVR